MKNSIYILLIMCMSCGPEGTRSDIYNYSLENKSGKPIVLESYRSDFPDEAPIVTNLTTGEKIDKIYEDGLPPRGYSFKTFLAGNRFYDSLKVVYNNERFALFVDQCNVDERNPFDVCFYDGLEERFTFTVEDFENAEPCDENCD